MARYDFVTLDVFTDQRFGGNPLAVFPDARGLDTATMQALAREFNMSETAFVLPPRDPAHTARVRIFTATVEIAYAGHPNVGVGWVLAQAGRDRDGRLLFEEDAGLVTVEVSRTDGAVTACRVEGPQCLSLGEPPTQEEIAACAGLPVAEIGTPRLASVALSTVCVPVSRDALARAVCDPAGFRAIGHRRPDLARICLLYLYARDGGRVWARMFAPSSGTMEDPATGSAAAALTGLLLSESEEERLALEIVQGVEMGRPSRMSLEAARTPAGIRTWVGGGCVRVLSGQAEV